VSGKNKRCYHPRRVVARVLGGKVVAGVAAARDLHLSVRAVTYRLARVKELTGRDPAHPADALALHVAVIGARVLDWPATRLERA
jgi:PucR C-terminal helix-turn-helix domain